ncbi:MAG TPA: phospholipase D-like domain-containing protein [Polyangia bacterium]|jgi:phosphatidylserine/phosphatidylglycerophosphate/cardiolipin synthase-like enzyme
MRLGCLLFAIGCAVAPARATEPGDDVVLVETAPIETTLDHADIPEAADVWVEMIAGAKKTIDLEEFYVTSQPHSRLTRVIDALLAAAARGVRVRLIVDDGFAKHEAATLGELAATGKLEIRRLDMHKRAGGIQHAKYFIVDGRDAYLGSQNLDWRSLTHIQEIGVRVRVPAIVGGLADLFETDWRLTGIVDPALRTHAHPATYPVRVDGAALTLVASPRGWLPDESLWELPRLVALVDGAKTSVHVQLLTYKTTELEPALVRAAARGVKVELLVSDWCKQKGCIEGLQKLQATPNLAIKLITIPPWSGGFVPYARVAHAKYLVVDGERAWIGTSNWERDYFYASRNVGLIIAGGRLPARLDRLFADDWSSPYAARVDPTAHYEPPRTH